MRYFWSGVPARARPVIYPQTDVFIFDCDGVIWKGDSLIEGIPSVLDRLREAGKR